MIRCDPGLFTLLFSVARYPPLSRLCLSRPLSSPLGYRLLLAMVSRPLRPCLRCMCVSTACQEYRSLHDLLGEERKGKILVRCLDHVQNMSGIHMDPQPHAKCNMSALYIQVYVCSDITHRGDSNKNMTPVIEKYICYVLSPLPI